MCDGPLAWGHLSWTLWRENREVGGFILVEWFKLYFDIQQR